MVQGSRATRKLPDKSPGGSDRNGNDVVIRFDVDNRVIEDVYGTNDAVAIGSQPTVDAEFFSIRVTQNLVHIGNEGKRIVPSQLTSLHITSQGWCRKSGGVEGRNSSYSIGKVQ